MEDESTNENFIIPDWNALFPLKTEVLQWLVEFAQADIDKMKSEEKEKWQADSKWRLKMFGVGRVDIDILEYKSIVLEEIRKAIGPKESNFYFLRQSEMTYYLDSNSKYFRFIIVPNVKTFREVFRFSLFTLLNVMPVHTIQRCPACDKIFINLTRRIKLFCSMPCSWRLKAEQRRKNDPEAYREKYRGIMKKRYEEKQKANGIKKINHYKPRKGKEA